MTGRGSWALTGHACHHCGSRVLVDGDLYRCSTCGATAVGGPEGICACGLNAVAGRQEKTDALFRCAPNPRRSANNPAEIVILCGDGSAEVSFPPVRSEGNRYSLSASSGNTRPAEQRNSRGVTPKRSRKALVKAAADV